MPFVLRHKSYYLAMAAWGGDIEPFARYIEAGGELGSEARAFLADHLRGKAKPRRGNRRLQVNADTRSAATIEIRMTQFLERCSEYEAISRYLEKHPSLPRETVRSWLKRSPNRVRK